MMKNFMVLLGVFALLEIVTCRPSAPTFTKDSRVELPGSEKISKRSAEPNDRIRFRPLPVFRKRSVNSIKGLKSIDNIQGTQKRFLRSLNNVDESDDEMKPAENGLVFLPLFRSSNDIVRNQRSRRSIQDSAKTEVLSNGAEADGNLGAETIIFRPVFTSQLRPVRSAIEKEELEGDNMVVAENGLIFRPLFRTRQRDTGSA